MIARRHSTRRQLTSEEDVVDPPAWITDQFTVSPGGRHADGKTENKLVLFKDGSYLEFIAFIDDDPARREGHWWDKPFGVVDYALTTPNEDFAELRNIKDRLSKTDTGISYQDPKEGGRHRPDGVELKWRVTFPIGVARGNVPFWCHDITERNRRVPITESNTTHPSGALGMAGVRLDVQDSVHPRLTSATAAILDKDLSGDNHYEVDVVHHVSNAKKPSIRIQHAGPDQTRPLRLSLVIQTPKEIPAIHHTIGDGTVSVVFEQRT